MKQILIELDDRSARDLERVAPAKDRVRADFIRRAIRHAIDLAMDLDTEAAYRAQPLSTKLATSDVLGWDEQNGLARPAARIRKRTKSRGTV
jgi:hypothetical protein